VRVLAFGSYDTRAHPRVGVLIEGLRVSGVTVDECNVPLGLDTAARVAMLRQPWRLPRLLVRLVAVWLQLTARARRLPRPDFVLVGYLGHFDVHLARLLFRRTPIVLDHLISASDTARDRGETGDLKQALLRLVDRAALRAADVVVVDTDEHLAFLPEHMLDKATVVPVGASVQWRVARRAASDVDEHMMRVVFYGLFTPLQGAVTIAQALGTLTDQPVTATMIGRGQDLEAARAAAGQNPRVRWIEWVDASDLPKVVADHDVCLGIFGTGPKALRVVPNKVYQGLAAGCAVVTSDSPAQRRVLGDAAAFVPPGDANALASVLSGLARAPQEVRRLRAAGARLADGSFTPSQVVRPLLERLATAAEPAA
jgi:glycosyltransferase involved in cell wall biosynthesis